MAFESPPGRTHRAARRVAAAAALAALVGGPVSAQDASRLSRAAFDTDAVTELQVDARTGVPTFLAGPLRAGSSAQPEAAARAFVAENAALFGVSGRDAVVVRDVQRDALGLTHVRVQQTVGGVPVFGGDAVVHLDRAGAVYAYGGTLAPEAEAVSTTPAVSPGAALAAARADVRPGAERPADELDAWRPDAHLVVYAAAGEPVLAYHVRLFQDAPVPANWEVFVDAQTGRVIERWNSIHTAVASEAPALTPFVTLAENAGMDAMTPVTGTGSSLYSGTVSIKTDQVSTTSFRLFDATRGAGVRTRDGRNGTSLPGVDVTDADNAFTATAARAAVDAHWGAAQVYDYYRGQHNRNSYDNAGAALNSTVHHQSRYNNAFWNGSYMVYGDGDGSQFGSLVELDICGHELTHAVTERTAGLVYNREPGALNEAVSDIFAVMIDRNDWWVGENSYTPATGGDALRYMDTPTRGGQPDTYANRLYPGSCTPSDANDYCGVHSNSGIPNHAAYLMAAGGTKGGVTVAAMGRDATEDVWYRALTTYFTSSTTFAGARSGTIQAATDLYGAGSAQVAAVTNAWAAVGVGSGGTTTPPPTGGQWYYVTQAYNSPHNYPNNYNASNTYTKAGASQVAMYVEQFATEANYDYVYFRDAAGTAVSSHTGTKAAFWAVVPGATIRANLVTDASVTAYGYRVTQVAYYATAPLTFGDVPMAVAPVAAPSDAVRGVVGSGTEAKLETALRPSAPNPTRGAARLAFTLAEATEARVSVVDVLGREVAVLHTGAT
ncbi:MAG TPA: M4 family metallopeptidase, partial [Rubricoccaceae bacterium]